MGNTILAQEAILYQLSVPVFKATYISTEVYKKSSSILSKSNLILTFWCDLHHSYSKSSKGTVKSSWVQGQSVLSFHV